MTNWFLSLLSCLPQAEKNPDAGKDWGQEKWAAKDKMVGWHHRFNGPEFEQTPGDSEGQRSLACCSAWGRKEADTTERLTTTTPHRMWPLLSQGLWTLQFHLWYLGAWQVLGYSSKERMKDLGCSVCILGWMRDAGCVPWSLVGADIFGSWDPAWKVWWRWGDTCVKWIQSASFSSEERLATVL